MSSAALTPYARPPLDPISLIAGAWRQRALIRRLVWRDVVGRYRGSIGGLAWSMLHPLLMLAVYTFVFAVVFEARWGHSGATESRVHFALVLFVGVIMHGLLSDAIVRAPSLILGNVNLVTKVVFPLETLAWSLVGSSLFHATINFAILILAVAILEGPPPLTALWLPVLVLPLATIALGLAWILSALGVFLRDITQLTGVLSAALMFLAPIFYSIENLREDIRPWFQFNPLTFPVEQARVALFVGRSPDFAGLAVYCAVAAAVSTIGYALFQKTRRGFADVL